MTTGAFAFMAVSWLLVLGLAGWSFARVLGAHKRDGPDGPDRPDGPDGPDGSGRGTSSPVRPKE